MNDLYHEIFQMSRQMPMEILLHSSRNRYVILEHWHRSLELDYILDCQAVFWVNGKKREIKGSGVVCINSGDIHAIKAEYEDQKKTEGPAAASIIISYDFLKEICPDVDRYCFDLEMNPEKLEELKQLYRAVIGLYREEKQGTYGYLRLNGLVYQMLFLLFTCFKTEKDQTVMKTQKYMERLRQVMDYAEQNYQVPLSLQETAEHFNISMEYLSRSFKKYTGSTYKEYVNRVRVGKAAREIMETDFSMLDIAMHNGFPDARSLIKGFKENFGMTPTQYKKENEDMKCKEYGSHAENRPHVIIEE